MKRALHLVDKLSDIVQRKPRLEITEIADRCLESLPRDAPALQARRSVSLTTSRNGRPARRDSALRLAATSSSKASVVRMF